MLKFLQIISLLTIPVLILFPITNNAFTICPFYNLTHLPCPGCGLGRSLIYIYHLEFATAFYYNPFGYLVLTGQWFLIATLIFTKLVDFAVAQFTLLRFLGFGFLLLFIGFGLIRIWLIVSGSIYFSRYFYTFK